MRSFFLIAAVFLTSVSSRIPAPYPKIQVPFGHVLNQSFYQTTSLKPGSMLPITQYRLEHQWTESIFASDSVSPAEAAQLGWISSLTLNQYQFEIGTGMLLRPLSFFEVKLNYYNRIYLGSQVFLEENNFENETLKDNWNNHYIANEAYNDDEPLVFLQSFATEFRLIIIPPVEFYGLDLTFTHHFIDINASRNGRLYDYKTELPLLPRDDLGELNLRQWFILGEGHYYILEMLYQATHFKERYINDIHFFPKLDQGSLSQFWISTRGHWKVAAHSFIDAGLHYKFQSIDKGKAKLENLRLSLAYQYLWAF